MGSPLGLLWQKAMKTAVPVCRCLHMSPPWANSSRASLCRLRRQVYARLYPVLLVKQDGSTIHIHYREPRRLLVMPLDLDSLPPEERRVRLRRREAQLRPKEEKDPELPDDFDVERYKRFWTKK
ncbi:large ribosomal subunit protein mL55 [Ochotona princeps]|uniref:large ribosomal subunit protein mL55 n=1 Tax=Ochotona princeps TaxID=9978 RepID=UPI002715258F|nr:large ribosomal subunit protein mL55 [Ochotona princeps]XP_058533356.1 large ribosomal subunit protein mL55 [Ochotona princeps]XP_058533357.1 large ribosomal subunit protein mL55 [Ochotona princeps]